jgi:protein associated with RNAse G/E
MSPITVIKKNLQGRETWRYTGNVLKQGDNYVLLEASFNRADTPFHGIILKRGDRFVETFYTDRWYNIFEMHDREDDQLKGWYCNIGYPAEIDHEQVSYIDLALDLLVYPDGRQLVLDEEEFMEMYLPQDVRSEARGALEELQKMFKQNIRESENGCP